MFLIMKTEVDNNVKRFSVVEQYNKQLEAKVNMVKLMMANSDPNTSFKIIVKQ